MSSRDVKNISENCLKRFCWR